MKFFIRNKLLCATDLPTGDISASAAKWEFIRDHDLEISNDGGPNTCSLCLEYYSKACKGCPVALATGSAFCIGTPIEKWHELEQGERADTAEAARVFLMSLKEPTNGINTDS